MSGGHFVSPWESPSDGRRIPRGCGSHWKLLPDGKEVAAGTFSFRLFESLLREYHTKQNATPFGVAFCSSMGYEKDGFAFLTDSFISSETVFVKYYADAKCEISADGAWDIFRLRGK